MRPNVIEVGQAAGCLAAGTGLFMLLPLAWFLLVVGLVTAALLTLVEHRSAPASPADTSTQTPAPTSTTTAQIEGA